MGFFLNSRPFLNAMTNTVQNLTIKRWCAWDSNPGGHDGRRRRIHWAMAAPKIKYFFKQEFITTIYDDWILKGN